MASRIRKINIETGIVHYVLRSASLAASSNVTGLDVSNNGTLYAADFANDVIYKIFEQGRVLGALAGVIGAAGNVEASGVEAVDGNELGGQNARFSSPFGICVDASDNIYVSDQANKRIKRISTSGRTKTLAGDGTTGDAINDNGLLAKFGTTLSGICVDKAGVLYVADTTNHKIKKIWPSGKVVSLAGSVTGFVNAQGRDARFASPADVAVDNQGNLYVADTGNNCIRKLDESGNATILAGGNSGAGTSGFVDGTGLAARFSSPKRLAMDPSNQFLLVLDSGNDAVRRVALNGKTTTFMHYVKEASGGDITIDKSGFVYVIESDV